MNEPDDQGAVPNELPEILVTPDPPEEAPPASAGIEPPGDGVPSAEPPAAPPLRAAIAQGGEFDYQRKAAVGEKSGFVQLRQFWNVSNFNVGLFMQQAGAPLWLTLEIAGWYAWKNSSNYSPDEPSGLHPRTREFIARGYKAGTRGAFDWTGPANGAALVAPP